MKTKIGMLLLIALFLVPTASAWWDTDYGCYQRITITNNNASETLPIGYPINITLNTSDDAKFNETGKDFRIITNNTGTDISLAWANITAFGTDTTTVLFKLNSTIAASGTDDNYFAYYCNGNAVLPSQTDNITKVKGYIANASTLAVFHLDSVNETSGSWTLLGNSNLTTGQIGDGAYFDGSESYALTGASIALGSLELWFKNDTYGRNYFVDLYPPPSPPYDRLAFGIDTTECPGSDYYYDYDNSSQNQIDVCFNSTNKVAGWNHLLITNNNTHNLIYINGVYEQAYLGTLPPMSAVSTGAFGSKHDGSARFMNGSLDEIRMMNTALRPIDAYQQDATTEPTTALAAEVARPSASITAVEFFGKDIGNTNDLWAKITASAVDNCSDGTTINVTFSSGSTYLNLSNALVNEISLVCYNTTSNATFTLNFTINKLQGLSSNASDTHTWSGQSVQQIYTLHNNDTGLYNFTYNFTQTTPASGTNTTAVNFIGTLNGLENLTMRSRWTGDWITNTTPNYWYQDISQTPYIYNTTKNVFFTGAITLTNSLTAVNFSNVEFNYSSPDNNVTTTNATHIINVTTTGTANHTWNTSFSIASWIDSSTTTIYMNLSTVNNSLPLKVKAAYDILGSWAIDEVKQNGSGTWLTLTKNTNATTVYTGFIEMLGITRILFDYHEGTGGGTGAPPGGSSGTNIIIQDETKKVKIDPESFNFVLGQGYQETRDLIISNPGNEKVTVQIESTKTWLLVAPTDRVDIPAHETYTFKVTAAAPFENVTGEAEIKVFVNNVYDGNVIAELSVGEGSQVLGTLILILGRDAGTAVYDFFAQDIGGMRAVLPAIGLLGLGSFYFYRNENKIYLMTGGMAIVLLGIFYPIL